MKLRCGSGFDVHAFTAVTASCWAARVPQPTACSLIPMAM